MSWLAFETPWALVGLALIPIVYWLHRTRSRELATDRLEIWERALARVPRARRRPFSWSMLLAILLFSALVLAASGAHRPERPGFRRLLALVDTSPSMLATDCGSGRSRRRAALEALAALELPEWIPVERRGLADRLVATVAPQRGRARLELALDAARLAGKQTCVLLYADGAGASSWPTSVPPNLFLRGVGSPSAKNRFFATASVSDPWPGPTVDLQLGVVAEVAARVVAEGTEVTHAVEGDEPFAMTLPRGRGGRRTVRIVGEDALALDDTIVVDVQAPWAPALLTMPEAARWLEPIGKFFEQTFAARRFATRSDFEKALRGDRAAPLLLVIDGGSLDAWPEDGAVRVLFGTSLPGLRGEARSAGFPDWNRSHEVLDGLDLSAVKTERRRSRGRGDLPGGVEILAWYGDDPFVLASREHRLLWFSTSLEDGNLAVQPFLPIACVRALRGLAESRAQTTVSGMLDPDESRIAARAPTAGLGAPVFYRPAAAYWPWLLAAALALFAIRLFLR